VRSFARVRGSTDLAAVSRCADDAARLWLFALLEGCSTLRPVGVLSARFCGFDRLAAPSVAAARSVGEDELIDRRRAETESTVARDERRSGSVFLTEGSRRDDPLTTRDGCDPGLETPLSDVVAYLPFGLAADRCSAVVSIEGERVVEVDLSPAARWRVVGARAFLTVSAP
jgi:hypothetical protein